MTASQQTVDFIAEREGFTPKAYWDGDHYSIGYGTYATPEEIKSGQAISQQDAKARLAQEADKAAAYVDGIAPPSLTDAQRTALTSMAYNVGSFGDGMTAAVRSGDPGAIASWMGKYTTAINPADSAGVANRRGQEIALFNGASALPPATTAVASVTPPLPRLRPDTQIASLQPPSAYPPNDFGGAPQLASYNTGAPAGPQQPFVDDLGGDGTSSPLHQFKVYEPSDVSAGPYGADALVKAAMSGDVNAFNKAMGDLTGAAAKDALTPAFLGGIGMDGVQKKLQGYFDQLQQQSPGAVRAMQTAYNSNPQLAAAVPPQLQSALQDAFHALPAQSTGQVAMPNLRPSAMPPMGATAPQPPQAPSGPTMVSDTTSLPPKDDPRFPPGWSPGQPLPLDAGDAGSWPENAATNFTQPNYWTPSTLNPSQQKAMGDYSDYTPPPFDWSPYTKSGQIQFSNYGQGGPQTPFFGIPQSQFQSTFNSMVPPPLPMGMPNFGTTASMKPPQAMPQPQPRPQQSMAMPPPTPLTPQQAFMQQAGPVPQNVNWQATLAPDPYAQPGTDNTYVLNDLGYGGGEMGGPGFNAFVYG